MVILLDIDGVMVTTPPWQKPEVMFDGFMAFNRQSVSSLNYLLSVTRASIILTSSHKDKYSGTVWQRIFANRGIHNTRISILENLPRPNNQKVTRAEEIFWWVNTRVNNEPFVIIDDDTSLNDLDYRIKARCVITKSLIGLDIAGAIYAIAILNTPLVLPPWNTL